MFIIKERFIYNCILSASRTGEVMMSEYVANDDPDILKFRLSLDDKRFKEHFRDNEILGITVELNIFDQKTQNYIARKFLGEVD